MQEAEMTPTAARRRINKRCNSINSVRKRYSQTSKRITAAKNIIEYFVFILLKERAAPRSPLPKPNC